MVAPVADRGYMSDGFDLLCRYFGLYMEVAQEHKPASRRSAPPSTGLTLWTKVELKNLEVYEFAREIGH